jgi:two-component system, cell cycle sensor histidine kinase and response regulator CckA
MKILHLEDNPNDGELVSSLICTHWPTCAVRVVTTRAEFLSELEKVEYDVILSDFNLPSFNGLEALKLALKHAPFTPFIFVSGTIGEDRAIEAVRSGAQDYVLKDSIKRLVTAIPRAINEVNERKERRAAEEAHLRLVSILESTPDFVGMMNLDGRAFYVNHAGLRMLGLPNTQDPGLLTLQDFYPPEVARQIIQEAIPVALREGTWAGETTLRGRDGHLLPVSQVIIAHKVASSRQPYLSTIMRDLTARKEAENRIREQADLINKARDAIIVADLKSKVTFWNRGAERVFGWPATEAIGRNLPDVFGAGSVSPFESVAHALETTGEWRGELNGTTKTGHAVILEGSATLVRDDDGKPKARLIIVTDVTEQKKLEEQFLRAQRLESIGMLAAGIAHDLNNVLAPILMGAPMLRERVSHPNDLRLLETLEKSAERGAGLVRQILGFAHGVDGGRQLVQVKHLMRDISGIIRETFPKKIRYEEDIPASPWPVNANPTQIHQVLLNLCVNARDAMPAGGTLRVRLEHCVLDELAASALEGSRPGSWVVICVEDTGTGIRPEVLAHVWEPFFTTKTADKGTGLGLSTVRGIVENHGGFVLLSTVPERGTTFRVYLPAAESDGKKSSGQTLHPFVQRGAGELILVADDEVHIRDVTAATLARQGYRVLLAGDGTEAVALFAPRSTEIRLVITDLSMPNLDGAAFAGIVRRLNPEVKILSISGHLVARDAPQPKTFSDAFMLKPFKAEALLVTVHQLLHPAATLNR